MKLNRSALEIITWAEAFSRQKNSTGVTPAILLLSFIENRNECVLALCNHFNIALPKLRQRITLFVDRTPLFDKNEFLLGTEKLAEVNSSPFIQARHLLQKLFKEFQGDLETVFDPWGIPYGDIVLYLEGEVFGTSVANLKIQTALLSTQPQKSFPPIDLNSPLLEKNNNQSNEQGGGADKKFQPQQNQNKAQNKGNTNPLIQYCRPLNTYSELGRLDPVFHRDREIFQLLEILIKRKKSNPLVIGETGVGKTSLIEGLAQYIVEKPLPKRVKSFEIFELQPGALIANSSLRGEFEQKVIDILNYCRNNTNAILFIDEIHNLVTPHAGGGMNELSTILKPALARGEIRVIGTTTFKDFGRVNQKDPAFFRRFERVRLEELSESQSLDVLIHLKPLLENHYDLTITKRALHLAIDLSKRYMSSRALPDKAIDVMDSACAHVILTPSENEDRCVTEEPVLDVVSEITGIKRANISRDKETLFATMEDKIKETIIGQDRVVERICGIIKLNKRHLELNESRPDGVFLFVGPTGVGKTAMSKSLSRVLVGDEKKLFRLDMSEYMEKHSVSRLIGSPPGYVDSEKDGILSGHIKEHPYCVILLDEIEKAHPDVINIFLQIFDDGRLTDNTGFVVDFSNTTVIMTSNIGAKKYFDETVNIGFSFNESGNKLLKSPEIDKIIPRIEPEIKAYFSSEFLNRLDEILFFNPLDEEMLRKICYLNVETAKERFLRLGKEIIISDEVVEKVLSQIDSFAQGAREIHRQFEREVFIPLSNWMIKNPDYSKIMATLDKENRVLFRQPQITAQELSPFPENGEKTFL